MHEGWKQYRFMDRKSKESSDGNAPARRMSPHGREEASGSGEDNDTTAPPPAYSLPNHLQEQRAGMEPVAQLQHIYSQGNPYSQHIAQNAAVQAVAALTAAIADQTSQQLPSSNNNGLHSQGSAANVANLVSALSQQQAASLLTSSTFAAQLSGILPLMLAPLQAQHQAQYQQPSWINPGMNPSVASIPNSALGGTTTPPTMATFQPAAVSREAHSNAAAVNPSISQTSTGAAAAAAMPQQANPAAAAASGESASSNNRPTVPLFLDYDREVLTEYQCLLRQQIELFEAGPGDIRENVKGRIKPVRVNQLGIRCRHCNILPPEARARGAVYFAYNVEGIYQLAQNMGKKHLCDGCGEIPSSLKQRLSQMYRSKENNNRRAGGKAYWVESLAVLGVYKDETTGMLRLKPPR